MVSAKKFEEIIELIEEKQGHLHTAARFRPTAERLHTIAEDGKNLLQSLDDKDLSEFK